MSFRVSRAGGAALAALRGGPATVFAAFERSCYVETAAGIACLGGTGLGMGPLNAILQEAQVPRVGAVLEIDLAAAEPWKPASIVTDRLHSIPPWVAAPWQDHPQAQAFLRWLAGEGRPDDALIGLGPGLTPAGDDFVGGAMIALRACGHASLADQVADWALPLSLGNTNRISRAHLECAAAGEGHEFLHDFLSSPTKENLEKLSSIGHTSGLDAAAGALLSLSLKQKPRRSGVSVSAVADC